MTDYDTDILVWSQHQAELLRRVAAGDPAPEAPDWTNIIEEVESVGNEQVFAVTSLLRQTLIPILKVEAWPLSQHVPHWQTEARVFRAEAADRFTPSMRQKIGLDYIHRRALLGVPPIIDSQPPLPLPQVCPFTPDELLSVG